jgi:hypothetical protein
MSEVKALQGLDFVIASAGLVFPSIHLIFAISLLSYDCLRHIRSIINLFSAVVPSLTKQSNKDFESVRRINGREICSIRSMVDLIIASTSKSLVIAYSSVANMLLVTRLHLVDDQ